MVVSGAPRSGTGSVRDGDEMTNPVVAMGMHGSDIIDERDKDEETETAVVTMGTTESSTGGAGNKAVRG